jgi:hypothetical protein
MLDGPAIQRVSLGAQPSARLVGRLAAGKRVGTWRQLDGTGALLGSFTLDSAGTGVEVIHDALGHSKRGTVIAGRREGTWILQDADGNDRRVRDLVERRARPPDRAGAVGSPDARSG